MATELGTGYVAIVPSARGIASSLGKELSGPAVKAGEDAGKKASSSFGGAFKSGVAKVAKIGLATGALAIGIGTGLAKIGEEFEGAFNTIARGTGATGKQLDGLEQSFKTVLASGAGSFDQVSQAVTLLYTRTGLTGKALDDFAGKQVTLARITKTDLGANLQSTTALFNIYGVAVGRQSDQLDVLFRASQVAGVTVTQLSADMQAAAPTARILGLNIDQTASVVAQLDRAGLPASKVMQALAGTFAKAAKAGKSPLVVIKDLVAEVKAAPDATTAATLAVKKFGIGARQAATLVAGLRNGSIDLTKSLDGGKGILATASATSTLSGMLAHLKNVVLVGLEPLATRALGAVTAGVRLLSPLLLNLSNVLARFSDALIDKLAVPAKRTFDALKLSWLGVRAGFAHPELILDGFGPVAKFFLGFGQTVHRVFDDVRTAATVFFSAFGTIVHSQAFAGVIDFIGRAFLTTRDIVVGVFDRIRGIVEKIGPPIERFFGRIADLFESNIGVRISVTAVALAALAAAMATIASPAILSIASQISGVFQGLQVAFASLASPVGLTVAAVALLTFGFILLYKHSATVRELVASVGDTLRTKVVPALQEAAAWVKDKLLAAFAELSAFWDRNGAQIIATIQQIGVVLRDRLGQAFTAIQPSLETFIQFLSRNWRPVLIGAAIALGLLVAPMATVVVAATIFAVKFRAAIQGAFGKVVSFFRSHAKDFAAIGERLGATFSDLADTIKETLQAVVQVVRVTLGIVIKVALALWDRFGHQMLDHIRIAFNAIIQIIRGALQIVQGVMEIVTGILTLKWAKVWQGIRDVFGGVWNVIVGILRHALNSISTIIGAGMAAISALWAAAWAGIKAVVSAAIAAVFGFLRARWPLLLAIITGPFGLAVLFISQHFNQIVGFAQALPGRVAGFFVHLWDGLKSSLANAVTWVGQKIGQFVGFVAGLPGQIAGAAVGMFDGITSAFKSAINFVIRGWNSLQFKIPGFDPPGPGPKFGGFTLGVPDIPLLAHGGVVTRPTIAAIGENPRTTPEIVSPIRLMADTFRAELRDFTPGNVINIDASGAVGLDMNKLGRVVQDALHQVSEKNGGIRVRVRN